MPEEHKIALIGESGVGKSSLTVRFADKTFSLLYDPTIQGINYVHNY
jgi:GTPase SAR1 family protein